MDLELRQGIGRLPAELREVVELTFFAGLTEREAGDVLCVPAGTVASRKHRAIAALRNSLGQTATPRPLELSASIE